MRKGFQFSAGRLLRFLMLFSSVLITGITHANQAEQSLLSDIKKSQQQLSKTETSIANQRTQLSAILFQLEQEVTQLREKTAVARRLADENTLGLSQLQQRLDSWQQQNQYQKNLLNRFLRQQSSQSDSDLVGLSDSLNRVAQVASEMHDHFYPEWKVQPVVQTSGEIISLNTLNLGPIFWFLDEQSEQAGLLAKEEQSIKVAFVLPASAQDGLNDLKTSNEGRITFDPSLRTTLLKAQKSESTFEHLEKGGLWAIPILLFAVFALFIAILKSFQLWRLPTIKTVSSNQLVQLLGDKTEASKDRFGELQQRLLKICQITSISQSRDDQLFNQLQEDKHFLDNWIGAIAVTASVSPLLGLLGTVSGMIETFKMMTIFGSGDPEVVSGGIAQALITTELGLVVAIPALILNALLSRKAKSYYAQLEHFAVQLSQLESNELSEFDRSVRSSSLPVNSNPQSAVA